MPENLLIPIICNADMPLPLRRLAQSLLTIKQHTFKRKGKYDDRQTC